MIVEVENLGLLEFPDNTPEDVIESTVKRELEAVREKPGVVSRAAIYTGGLTEDIGKSIVQGAVGDNLRFFIGTQERRNIGDEVSRGQPPSTRARFHMSEWSRTQQEMGRPITTETWQSELAQFMEDERTESINRMRGIIEKLPQPREREDLFGKAMVGATRFLGSMGISAVNPLAGTVMVFTQIAGLSYDEYRRAGVKPERAWDAAMINALLQTPIEQAGNLLQIGFLKHLGKQFIKGGVTTKRIVDFVGMLGKNAAAEGMEEFLQVFPEEIAHTYAANPDKSVSEVVDQVMGSLTRVAQLAKEKGVPAAALGAVGGAGLGGLAGTVQAPFTLGAYVDDIRYERILNKAKKDLPEFAKGMAAAVQGGLVTQEEAERTKEAIKDAMPDKAADVDKAFKPVEDILTAGLAGEVEMPEGVGEEVIPEVAPEEAALQKERIAKALKEAKPKKEIKEEIPVTPDALLKSAKEIDPELVHVGIKELHQKFPDLSKEVFDTAILDLRKQGKINLQRSAASAEVAKKMGQEVIVEGENVYSSLSKVAKVAKKEPTIEELMEKKPIKEQLEETYARLAPILEHPQIKSAAIKLKDGTVIEGKNHTEIWEKLTREQKENVEDDEGFIDLKGNFLTHAEAVKVTGIVKEVAPKMTKGTIPNQPGNKYIILDDGTIYETNKPLHAAILEDFPEVKPENISMRGIIGKAGEKISLSLVNPFSMSNQQQQNLRDFGKAIMDRLRQIVGQKEVLDKMEIIVTPIIEVDPVLARESIEEHAKAGRPFNESKLAGLTTFTDFAHATVQLSAFLPDFKATLGRAYHEYHDICWEHVMPDNDRAYILDFYGNKEDAADRFAEYMLDERSLSATTPGPVIRIFRRFKRFLQMMRNWLDKKGFRRPEDIWGKLIAGQYKEVSEAKYRERVGVKGKQVTSILEVAPEPGPGIKHTMLDTEKEKIFQAAQDYTGPAFWEKARDLGTRLKNKATREFEHLPKTKYYAELRNTLLVLAKQKGVQAPKALQEVEEITKGLNDVDYHNFVRYVVFKDLQEEAKLQEERGDPIALAEGLTKEEVDSELARIETTRTPAIKTALAERQKKWKELRTKYVAAFKRHGIDMEEKLKRQHYFRHIVMDNIHQYGLFGTGQRLEIPMYRSHLRSRTGTEKMIYTNYVAVEHEVMAQMLYDIQVADAIYNIDFYYNEFDQFKQAATHINYTNVIKVLQAYADALDVPPTQKRPTGVDLYKQLGTKMAIGFDNLGRLAAADELPSGPGGKYDGLIEALADNWLENAELKKEMGKDWTSDDRIPLPEKEANQLLGFANYILKAEEAEGAAKGAAAAVFKGIAERRQAVKDILGHQFVTWEKLVKEDPDFSDWQPRQGNIFFNVYTIPEQTALDLLSGKLKEVGVEETMVRRMLAMGPKRRPLVIRNEIHDTLNSITPTKNEAWAWHRKVLKVWKIWQLVMPRRFFKYNFRNISGDADAVFAGNPSTIKKVKQATSELIHLMMLRSPLYNRLSPESRTRFGEIFGKPELTPELNEWLERGGYGTLLQAQEMDEYDQVLKFGEELIRKQGVKSFKDVTVRGYKAYWKAVRRLTDTREAILRYSAYLDYLEQMKADPDGLPRNYGASVREEIQGLHNIRDRAFWLSNDLLGAYDRVSVVGQTVREHMIPFWSWKEVNFVRYKRLLQNAIHDHGLVEGIGRRVAGTAIRSPFLAARVGALVLRAGFLWAMLQLWNLGIMGNNDEDLPEEVRNRPHLTLWRDADGEVQYFSRLGALGDLLEWVALDTAVADIQDLFTGRKTLKQKATEMAQAPVNVIIQGAQPFLKVGAEFVSRQAMFPDVFNPRPIRDKMLHLTRSLGVENEYIALMDLFGKPMPSKPYWKTWKTAFWYERDAFESAYYDIFTRKRDFMKKVGKYSEGFWLNPHGNALYNCRAALRYGDEDAFLYYMQRYFELGGTQQGLQRSLDMMHPLAGMNKANQDAFVAELTPDELDKLVKALAFYTQLRTGVHMKEIWEAEEPKKEKPKTSREAIGKIGEVARIIKSKGQKEGGK